MRRRATLVIALSAALAFAWLALPPAPRELVLSDMDVLYQLHRARRAIADWPHASSLDTYSHAGRPWHCHWLAPHATLLASVARAAGRDASADVAELGRTLRWLPPVAGALAAACAAALALATRRGLALAASAGALAALSGDAVVVFRSGAVDHHGWAALGLALAALGRARHSRGAWRAGLALALFLTPEATPLVTVLVAVVAGSEILSGLRGSDEQERSWRDPPLEPAAIAALALIAHRALDPDRLPLGAWSVFDFSLFHVAWLAALGLALSVPVRLSRATPRRTGLVIALAVALPALAGGAALAGTREAAELVGRLTATSERLAVGEEISLLRFLGGGTHWSAWASLVALAAVAAAARVVVDLRARRGADALFAGLLALAATTVALVELRHARAVAPLVAVAIAAAAGDALAALGRWPRLDSVAGRRLAVALVALVVAPPAAWHALEMRRATRRPLSALPAVEHLAGWLREATPSPGPRDRRPAWAIFGPWEWGHHLNVLGDRAVVVDGFNHVGTDEALRATWLAPTPEALAAQVKAQGADMLVVGSATGSLLGLLRRTDVEIVRRAPDLPGGALFLEPLLELPLFRLEASGGVSGEHANLRPRYLSPETHPLAFRVDGEVRVVPVPRFKAYDVVRGARVMAWADAGAAVTVTCDVHLEGGGTLTWARTERAAGTLPVEVRVPLVAPVVESTFRVPACRLEDGRGHARPVVLTAEQVASGAVVFP